MKTNEFKKAIDGLNTSVQGGWYYSESVDTISVWLRQSDNKGNIVNARLVNISKDMPNDYAFFSKSNNFSHSNMQIDIIVRKEFIDLINDYASTPIEEREDNEDKIKSMQETIDKLTIDRDYFQHQFIASQPTIQPLSHINDRLPFSERIESNLHDLNVAINDLKHDLDIIKNKKQRWFD